MINHRYLAISCITLMLISLILTSASNSFVVLLEPSPSELLNELPILKFVTKENASCMLQLDNTTIWSGNTTANKQHNISLSSLELGNHSWQVSCLFNMTNETKHSWFFYDNTPPVISVENPEQDSVVDRDNVNITITVNEEANCRASMDNKSYSEMSKHFVENNGKFVLKLVDLEDGNYRFFIKCKDRVGNIKVSELNFTVNLPITASIYIDTNTDEEGHYFLPEGRKKLRLKLSKPVENVPTLYYKFEDGIKHDVALTGSGRNWYGYVIIEPKMNDKIAVFHASYENELIGIKKGQMFVVDSESPPPPLSIVAKETATGVLLEWYYKGEDIDFFKIYKSTKPELSFFDFYRETTRTSFVDKDTEHGMTYYYSVSAVDLAGNEGQISETTKITLGMPEKAPEKINPKVIARINQTIDKLKTLQLDLESARHNLKDTDKLKLNELISDFALLSEIEARIKQTDQFIKQLEQSKSATEQDVEKLTINIDNFIEETKKSAANAVVYDGSAETLQSLANDGLEKLVLRYSELAQLSSEELPVLKKKAAQLSELIRVSVSADRFTITLLDGRKEQVTKIEKRVSYSGTEKLKQLKLVEFIPKEAASSSQKLKFKTLNYEVIEQDPVISWNINELGYEDVSIVYYIKNGVTEDILQRTTTVVIPTTLPQAQQTEKMTGFAVSEQFSGVSIHTLLLSLGILIAVSLAVYYFFFTKPASVAHDYSLKLSREKTTVAQIIAKADSAAEALDFKTGLQLYYAVLHLIKAGQLKLTKQQLNQLRDLRTKLIALQTIFKAHKLYANKDYEKLNQALNQLKPLVIKFSLKDKKSKLTDYLLQWYYHYFNTLDFIGKEK